MFLVQVGWSAAQCAAQRALRRGLLAALSGLLAACVTTPPSSTPPPTLPTAPTTPPRGAPPAPVPTPAPAPSTEPVARYQAVAFEALPTLTDADLIAAWPAWQRSCGVFLRAAATTPAASAWRRACLAAPAATPGPTAIRRYLANEFDSYSLLASERPDAEPAPTGRITGYYEPQLAASRTATARFRVPLLRVPDDLLTIDLASVLPELSGKRVRGRLIDGPQGRRVVPYATRAEIEASDASPRTALFFVEDPVEAFFLQVQGSGRLQLADGSIVRVGYADTNGHPYRSLGRWLVDQGELTLDQASMQSIQQWARANPARVREALNQNPSYVFFRELPLGDAAAGPVGAQTVPLTAGYSLAVDPRFVPLGSLVVIRTLHPTDGTPLERLMLAQDTGGAIRGPLRFDFFWGTGNSAGEQAGRQRHDAEAWLLLPKGLPPEAAVK